MDIYDTKKEIVILKLCYSSLKTKTYAWMLFFIDKVEHVIIEKMSSISHKESFIEDAVITDPWINIENIIKNKKIESVISNEFISPFESKINSIIDDNMINVISLVEMEDENITLEQVEKSMLNQMDDNDANIRIVLEKCFDKDIEEIRSQNETNVKINEGVSVASEEAEKVSEGIYVGADLILSPIYGKPVGDLEEGDVIMVRIHNESESEKYTNTLLKARYGKIIRPVKGIIKNKKITEENKIILIVEVFENIYGVIKEKEPVKVQLFTGSFEEKKIRASTIFVWSLVVVLTVISIGAIYFLIMTQ